MKTLVLISSLFGVVALSACGGGDNKPAGNVSVNSDGTCTQKFIDDFNELDRTINSSDIQAAKNKCDSFRSVHAQNTVCKAERRISGEEVQINVPKIYDACAHNDNAVAQISTSKPPTTAQNNPTVTSSCSDQFLNDVAVTTDSLRAFLMAPTRKTEAKVNSDCESFVNSYPKQTSCTGVNNETGETMSVDITSIYDGCKVVKDFKKPKKHSTVKI